MEIDAKRDLRLWASSIEEALKIVIGFNQDGAFTLHTTGGSIVGIEAAPMIRALIFTGQIGTLEETTSIQTLRALLALNTSAGMTGTGVIGLAPENNAILFRIIWTPHESAWTQDDFISILTVFSEQVDALSDSLKDGTVERILEPSLHESSTIETGRLV